MRLPFKIYFFKACENEKKTHIILFPYQKNMLFCGISGIISFRPAKKDESFDIEKIQELVEEIKKHDYDFCTSAQLDFRTNYLGLNSIKKFLKVSFLNFDNPFSSLISYLKKEFFFFQIYQNPSHQKALENIVKDLQSFLKKQEKQINKVAPALSKEDSKFFLTQIESLKDLIFCISSETLTRINESKKLFFNDTNINQNNLRVYRKINLILNSIDKTEVRGRDSAGISLLFVFDEASFGKIKKAILSSSLKTLFQKRCNDSFLKNNSVYFNEKSFSFCITYKTSSEIGSLGDNVKFLREQIRKDSLLFLISSFESSYFTIISHTRWASVGAVSDANCHPIDNFTEKFFFTSLVGKDDFSNKGNKKLIHICLNGDIDNYLELKKEYERKEGKIFDEITTDSKIIPLQIQSYLKKGHNIQEAFLMAVNDFEGSHAIIMHTDLAPGKIFIAQKGSGQTAFVSISENEYMISSEIYGLVEHSSAFIKLEGAGKSFGNHDHAGQILILDQNAKNPISDIKSIRYNADVFDLEDDKIQYTQITSRDVDRGAYTHYFLKEISESFLSFQKTISNYWSASSKLKETSFNTDNIPLVIMSALKKKKIKKIFFIGQGTAGVAADACSYILQNYLGDEIQVASLKASEFSGYAQSSKKDMSDILLVAITQSGTTADTNYTVDFAKKHKAYCLAIVNKRDSDITFKVDGVIYTSTGRDIEMSVASTKAFYSQIAAGAMLSLHLASILKVKSSSFINSEINELLKIPNKMTKILEKQDAIKKSAYHYATRKKYWATVGSGANKIAADEIRIKLSELCYRTISSDYVEDKKHIDLSAEPLIIVCAAGTKSNVLSDIKKDVAIFNAHKATPIVIGDHEDAFFKKYSSSFFCIPKTKEHFAPILNTLCGHLWGYYAALSMHEFSTFIDSHKKQIKKIIEKLEKEKDIYEIILEEAFKTQIAKFYEEFMEKKNNGSLPASMGYDLVLNLVLLLKYLSGKLSILDFKIDFSLNGTPSNMIKLLFEFLDASISEMMRPVDAIKHQAKTVTVGTSRASEEIGGIIFDYYQKLNFSISQLSNQNVIVLKNIQNIIGNIDGSILYKIENLNILGEQTKKTKIVVVKKLGSSKKLKSRVEDSNELKGTKSIIVREKNVFVGKGISDKKNIVIIPIISSKSNLIEYILLLSASFTKESIPLFKKIKALGGKYQRIKNIVQEKNIKWKDEFLDEIAVEDLFGDTAEKSAEEICKMI